MGESYRPEKVHKIILKISGEILAGESGSGYDLDVINTILDEIVAVKNHGFSIGIVLGGGNIFRGASDLGNKLNRYTADNIGMLATIQNALVLSELLRKRNHRTEIFSAIEVNKVAKLYTPNRANTSLNEGKICFFCAGTGNPYFTTDTAALLRAIELKADAVFKGTKVDGVYSADPVKNESAKLFTNITFDEVLAKQLKVMDMTSFSLAREYNMPIKVFNINKKNNLSEAILNKDVGTYIHQ
jgi:uridylate kinase